MEHFPPVTRLCFCNLQSCAQPCDNQHTRDIPLHIGFPGHPPWSRLSTFQENWKLQHTGPALTFVTHPFTTREEDLKTSVSSPASCLRELQQRKHQSGEEAEEVRCPSHSKCSCYQMHNHSRVFGKPLESCCPHQLAGCILCTYLTLQARGASVSKLPCPPDLTWATEDFTPATGSA